MSWLHPVIGQEESSKCKTFGGSGSVHFEVVRVLHARRAFTHLQGPAGTGEGAWGDLENAAVQRQGPLSSR